LRVIKFWKCSEKYTIKKISLFLDPPVWDKCIDSQGEYFEGD